MKIHSYPTKYSISPICIFHSKINVIKPNFRCSRRINRGGSWWLLNCLKELGSTLHFRHRRNATWEEAQFCNSRTKNLEIIVNQCWWQMISSLRDEKPRMVAFIETRRNLCIIVSIKFAEIYKSLELQTFAKAPKSKTISHQRRYIPFHQQPKQRIQKLQNLRQCLSKISTSTSKWVQNISRCNHHHLLEFQILQGLKSGWTWRLLSPHSRIRECSLLIHNHRVRTWMIVQGANINNRIIMDFT